MISGLNNSGSRSIVLRKRSITFFEKQDYAAAYRATTLGLELENTDKEWQDRFRWYAGLYQFLLDKPKKSIQIFKSI